MMTQARSLGEHAAHDHRGVLRRHRRRRRDRRCCRSPSALGLPDRFARRIARNTQLLLLEESNIAKVADPAAGSGGIEDLTEKLCRAAWTLFQEIEAAGGAPAALEKRLDPGQDRQGPRRARGRDRPPQGCAHRHQRLPQSCPRRRSQVLDVKPVPLGRPVANITYPPLARSALPSRSSSCATPPTAMLAKTGARPKIFLANLGTRRRVHRARDLRQELLRGRRHRGTDQRRLQRAATR